MILRIIDKSHKFNLFFIVINNKMDKLNDYFKNEYEIDEPQFEDLSEYEIGLLTNVINNIDIGNLLNDTLSPHFFNLLGIIMENKIKYDEAKKYYLIAIEKGNSVAMHNLGAYYKKVEKNYNKAKKYYLMAIEKGISHAMNNLGVYYYRIENNYNEAKKYYLMAIEKNNIIAHVNFKRNIAKYNDHKSFINCHVNLIKNNNFTFVDKLNEFVNKYFNKCLKYISKNTNVLHKHLDILKNVNFAGENHCMNCNKYTLLIKSNCNHNFCLACNNLLNKCLICKQSLKKIDFANR